jgi:cytochrome c-type biogenesis protein CcmH
MLVFTTVALLLMAATILFLLPPLLQGKESKNVIERKDLNILLYKDQLKELETDLNNGTITQDQFDQAQSDLERSLMQDVVEEVPGVTQTKSISGKYAAIFIGIAVPLTAISMYSMLGAGEKGFDPGNVRPGMTTEGHEGTLEQQVRKLQNNVQENPDDLEGWVMLARSYYFLKQYQAASDAFARTVAMTGEQKPGLLADYADALAMAGGRTMTGKPYDLVKKALTIDANHQKSLWLAATATYQAKDYKTTLGYWLTLRKQFPEDSDNYLQMTRNIAEAKQFLGESIDAEIAIMQKAKDAEAQTAAAGATGSSSAAAPGTAPAGGVAKVSGIVVLDSSLKDKASPSDTLFIFARAATGPRMPLAIIRTTVSELPLDFTLDDSMAMNPQMKMSRFKQVVVGARISKSGNAMPQSGDLAGASNAIPLGTEGLTITISNVTP